MKPVSLWLIVLLVASGHAFAEDADRGPFDRQVQELVDQKDFKGLDALAESVRTKDERLPGGEEKLARLYDDIGVLSSSSTNDSQSFAVKHEFILSWITASPQSVTARIAMARIYLSDALRVVPKDSFANLLPLSERAKLSSRLTNAGAYLKGIEPKLDPYISVIKMYVAVAGSEPRKIQDEVYATGIKLFPTFEPLYATRAHFLGVDYYGMKGELPLYFGALAKGGEDDEIHYVAAALGIAGDYNNQDLFHETGLDWNEFKKDLALREKRYGASNAAASFVLNGAVLNLDHPAALGAAEKLAHVPFDPTIFPNQRMTDTALTWARLTEHTPDPLILRLTRVKTEDRIESLLLRGEIDILEDLGNWLRAGDLRSQGGASLLTAFYEALGATNFDCNCGAYEGHAAFTDKEALLQKWIQAYPASITPKIGMAKLLLSAARELRGANNTDVNSEDMRPYSERIASAADYLKMLDMTMDPNILGVQSSLAEVSDDTRKKFDELWALEMKYFPAHYEFYTKRADLLLRTWIGRAKDNARFNASLLESPTDRDNNLIGYSFAAEGVEHQETRQEFCAPETGITFANLRRSFELRGKKYGLGNHEWNELLDMALSCSDVDGAKEAAEHIETRDPAVWVDQKSFDDVIKWATQPDLTAPSP